LNVIPASDQPRRKEEEAMGASMQGDPEPVKTYQTAESLFQHPTCTRLVLKGGSTTNLFVERGPDGYRLLEHTGQHPLHLLRAGTLEDLVRISAAFSTELIENPLTKPCWLDISAYPELPADARYFVFQEHVRVLVARASPYNTNHGPMIIYGSFVESAPPQKNRPYVVQPQQRWLVVEYPARTFLLPDIRWVMQARSSWGLRLRVKIQHWLDRLHLSTLHLHESPGRLEVYGRPPPNWREGEQLRLT
jgi:hypothetical protein